MIAETYDARSELTAAVSSGSDLVAELQASAGFIIGKCDWMVQQLTGTSLLEAAIRPLVGDWVGMEKAVDAWTKAGTASAMVGANFAAGGHQVQVWRGDAASAYVGRTSSVGETFATYQEGCAMLAELTRGVVEVARSVANVVATLIGLIGDWIERLIIEASIPVLGWAAGAIDAGINAPKMFAFLRRIAETLQRLTTSAKTALKALQTVATLLGAVASLASAVDAGYNTHQASTGDDAASNLFGTR